jgi:hypothetical protein
MLFLLYLIVKVAARLLALGRSNGSSRDLEILVLQHQVRVLQRKAGRPRLRPLDRAVMAAASRILPRERWVSFIVTPQTILRWHRELAEGVATSSNVHFPTKIRELAENGKGRTTPWEARPGY